MVSINVPPPQLWGGQHTEMFVNHVTVFSQSVTRNKLSHTILHNVLLSGLELCELYRVITCNFYEVIFAQCMFEKWFESLGKGFCLCRKTGPTGQSTFFSIGFPVQFRT